MAANVDAQRQDNKQSIYIDFCNRLLRFASSIDPYKVFKSNPTQYEDVSKLAYARVVGDPLWLDKIEEDWKRLDLECYQVLPTLILMLENAIRYHGRGTRNDMPRTRVPWILVYAKERITKILSFVVKMLTESNEYRVLIDDLNDVFNSVDRRLFPKAVKHFVRIGKRTRAPQARGNRRASGCRTQTPASARPNMEEDVSDDEMDATQDATPASDTAPRMDILASAAAAAAAPTTAPATAPADAPPADGLAGTLVRRHYWQPMRSSPVDRTKAMLEQLQADLGEDLGLSDEMLTRVNMMACSYDAGILTEAAAHAKIKTLVLKNSDACYAAVCARCGTEPMA